MRACVCACVGVHINIKNQSGGIDDIKILIAFWDPNNSFSIIPHCLVPDIFAQVPIKMIC
jgi:hypothetical protein